MKKTNTPPFINRILFYIIAFFTGIVVLPATGGVAFALILGSVICPIGGVVKLIGSLLGYHVPISFRKYLVWVGEMKRNMMINQNP